MPLSRHNPAGSDSAIGAWHLPRAGHRPWRRRWLHVQLPVPSLVSVACGPKRHFKCVSGWSDTGAQGGRDVEGDPGSRVGNEGGDRRRAALCRLRSPRVPSLSKNLPGLPKFSPGESRADPVSRACPCAASDLSPLLACPSYLPGFPAFPQTGAKLSRSGARTSHATEICIESRKGPRNGPFVT